MPITSIKKQLENIPQTSGVYQFLDTKDQILYVGKAKNLRKRVTSYTKENHSSARISYMISLAQKVDFIQTGSEVEALLLEHNLIKKLSPKFNILLRDDKTFPQILITDHEFPQIAKYRPNLRSQDEKKSTESKNLFGPFASARDVNCTIDILRKIFLLRDCSDSEFKSRKKPCLEYQIKRCLAPCVGLVSKEDYQSSVKDAIGFLEGKSVEVQKKLSEKMFDLSKGQEYEKAAFVRDQINSLDSIQAKQNINISELNNSDIITIVANDNKACVYISFFRAGQNFGSKPYFYDIENTQNLEKNSSNLLANFLGQFYLDQTPPELILTNINPGEKGLMEALLTKISNKKVTIRIPQKGSKLNIIKDQSRIALQNLERKTLQDFRDKDILLDLKKIFDLSKIPQKIEIYDNSHTSGTNAVGVLVTAGVDGFVKSGYRKFNIRNDISADGKNANGKNDDTAMLREVLTRRFSKLETKNWPDLILIDGGKLQLNTTKSVFDYLGVKIEFICMSKGENRNAGEEKFHKIGENGLAEIVASDLPKHHPVMHYLQRLRDEAHRFAIMTHRKRRQNNMFPK